jgi:hypothetical protein
MNYLTKHKETVCLKGYLLEAQIIALKPRNENIQKFGLNMRGSMAKLWKV